MSEGYVDPLKINPREASLGTLVRGIIVAEINVDHVAVFSEQYKSKLREFYQELDNREKRYSSYKHPPIYR